MYQAHNGVRLTPKILAKLELKPLIFPYFKVLVDCYWGFDSMENNIACGAVNSSTVDNVISKYRTLNDQNIANLSFFDDGQFILVDGSSIFIENATNSDPLHVFISVDVNGPNKRPNQWGHDLFTFQLMDDGKIIPMGAPGTEYTNTNSYCTLGPSSNKNNGIACTYYALTDKNYWKNLP